jgi:hypothetical protein
LPTHEEIELAAWTVAAPLLEKLKLPEDLRGRTVNMVEFADAKTCEFFYPAGRSDSIER